MSNIDLPRARTRSEIDAIISETLASELAAAKVMHAYLAKTTRRFHSEVAYIQRRIKRESLKR